MHPQILHQVEVALVVHYSWLVQSHLPDSYVGFQLTMTDLIEETPQNVNYHLEGIEVDFVVFI